MTCTYVLKADNFIFAFGITELSASSAQLNMRGVFLHVLGDALGSVVVIISALVIKFVEDDWRYKVDPALRWADSFP